MPLKTLAIIQNYRSNFGGYKPGNYIKNIIKKDYIISEFFTSKRNITFKIYKTFNNFLTKFFNESITLPCLLNSNFYKKKDIIFIAYGNEIFNFNIIKKKI